MEKFIVELRGLGSKERAEWDERYHKSDREHWGVPTPVVEKAVKAFAKGFSDEKILSFAKELWATDLFDPMMAAGKILAKAKPSRALWETLLEFLKMVDGWALEDLLAHVAWKCILANELLLDEVDEWTKHPNFWMRRAALVYTLPFAKPGRNPERMLGWAGGYAKESEWFIQKAIGWWLRVLGEHNPERVLQFLSVYGKDLKGVARKEATRKLRATV